MFVTTEEKENMIGFAKWLSDNTMVRNNDTNLWYSKYHSQKQVNDEEILALYLNNPFKFKNDANETFSELKKSIFAKPISINKDTYPLFNYHAYWKNDRGFDGKMKSTYKVGQVVYIKPENRIAVVLGIIDEGDGTLRTDACGMVSYNDIEFYNPNKHLDAIAHTALKSALKIFDKE